MNGSIATGNFLQGEKGTYDVVGTFDATSSYNVLGDPAWSGGLDNEVNGNIVGAWWSDVLETTSDDNGGPTPTHALLETSPARDVVPTANCLDLEGNPNSTDQRGLSRPYGDLCDMGAFELQADDR